MSGNTIDLGVGTDTLKFTENSDTDQVTVTSTTIAGAKALTYEKTATSVDITLAAGADIVIFEDQVVTGGDIVTNSGNDSIQFLKQSKFDVADLGAGADSVYGAEIITATLSVVVQDKIRSC